MARRRLVLEGPAAAAVERLARQAGISPAELVKRALRREDEAQRSEGGSDSDAGSPDAAEYERPPRQAPPLRNDTRGKLAWPPLYDPGASRPVHLNPHRVSPAEFEDLTGGPGREAIPVPLELMDFDVEQGRSSSKGQLDDGAVAVRRPGDAFQAETLIISGVFDGNRLSFEIPYPEPGEFGFPFSGGQVVVTVPPGRAKPSVRFERDAETGVTRREPDRG
jgi:hypothetical protein